MDYLLKHFNFKEGRVKLFFTLAILVLIIISWLGVIDRQSGEYIDGAILQSTIAFGTARMLNGLISVLQSTSIELNLLVTGGSIGIGQLLEPINNLIEDYSYLMKLSIGSLVIQKILLTIVSDTFFKILITLSGLTLLISLYNKSLTGINTLMKTFIFMVFLRFSLVLVVALNGMVDNYFLVDQTRQDIATLEALPGEVDAMELDGMSEEQLEDALTNANTLLDEQRDEIESKMSTVMEQKADLESDLLDAESDLADIEEDLSTIERLNHFSRSEEHAKAIARVEQLEDQIENTSDIVSEFEDQLTSIEEERAALNEAREDGTGGFWSSMGDGAASLESTLTKYANPATYTDMKEKFEGVVDTILRVMALFLLKTLILPLLFLFALTKGVKLIWAVDLQEVIRRKPDQPTGGQDHQAINATGS